jgi:hypothetical protein
MEDNSSRFGVWRRLAFTVVPLLAIAFGSVAFFGAATTEAAASASLGVGCSASNNNGVVTVSLRFRVAASGNGSDIDSIQLTVDDGGGPVSALSVPDASVGTTFGPSTVNYPVPSVSDVYNIVLTVTAEDASVATRTALATVTVGPGGVSCKVQSPAP